MKKLLIGFVVLIVAGAIFFTINRSVDKAVNLKIEELNQNGFSITQNNSNLPMKIRKDGEIQVIDAIKALDFIVKNIEESQAKEVFVEFLNIFDSQSKQLALEGTKFDYDFSLNIFTKEMKADLYLKELSVVLQNELENSEDEASKELLSILKQKAIHLKVDDKMNFTLDDIAFSNSGSLISLRGINGDKNSLNVALFKIIGANNESFVLEDMKSYYKEIEKNIDTKFSVSNLSLDSEFVKMSIKNILFDGSSKNINDKVSTKDKISFDEFSFISNDVQSLINGSNVINAKNSEFSFSLDNLPYKQYKELMKVIDSEDEDIFSKAFDSFFEELVKSDVKVSSSGVSSSFSQNSEKIFEKLRYEANLSLNKNMKPALVSGLNDIFEKIDIKIDLDKVSADKLILPLKESLGLNYKDIANDDLKRFEISLKDGIYINDIKLLEEKDLKFTQQESDFEYYDDENLTTSYDMIGENLLKITFGYKSSLNENSQKGLVVSFPQLKDKSRVVSTILGDLKEINVYEPNSELFTINPYESIKNSFLAIEAYDDTLSENSLKEFSIILNIKDFQAEILEINFRAYSIGSTDPNGTINYEIVPKIGTSFTKDEQQYPVKISDIELSEVIEQKVE